MTGPASVNPNADSISTVMVDPSRCTHETLGDETLVIDTSSGSLFVLRGLAVPVWSALVDGPAEPSALVTAAHDRYGPEFGDALTVVLDGLSGVFVANDDGRAVVAWPETTEVPTIERFDEIADILTLDPIHDVKKDSGWPYEGDAEHS